MGSKRKPPTPEQIAAAKVARSLADLPHTLRRRDTRDDLKTRDFRATVAALLQEESPYIGAILAEVRQENPTLYLKTVSDLAEYVAPKLQRVEAVVENMGGPPSIEIVLVQRLAQQPPQAVISSPVIESNGHKALTVEVDVP